MLQSSCIVVPLFWGGGGRSDYTPAYSKPYRQVRSRPFVSIFANLIAEVCARCHCKSIEVYKRVVYMKFGCKNLST